MDNFESKTLLIVGGSSGIGAAAAKACTALGADVTIASRSQEKLDAVAADVGSHARTALIDTTDHALVEAFFTKAGRFDHVVISVAQTPGGPARELALSEAYAAMNSKFWGAYRVARGEDYRRRLSGAGLRFLSVRPSTSSVLQGAINAAPETLARGLALELSPVRVNTVSPGLIATPLWSKLGEQARQSMYEGRCRPIAREMRWPAGRRRQRHRLSREHAICNRVHRAGGRWRRNRLIRRLTNTGTNIHEHEIQSTVRWRPWRHRLATSGASGHPAGLGSNRPGCAFPARQSAMASSRRSPTPHSSRVDPYGPRPRCPVVRATTSRSDLFRWNQLWPAIADYFDMPLAEPQTLNLSEYMADKGPLWERMTAKYGLAPVPYERVAAWGFGDFIFRCHWDVITGTTKIRQAGFHDVVDSTAMFLRLFDEFRARKAIP